MTEELKYYAAETPNIRCKRQRHGRVEEGFWGAVHYGGIRLEP